MAQMCQGLAAWQVTGAEVIVLNHLSLLAATHGSRGQAAEGLRVLSKARRWQSDMQSAGGEAELSSAHRGRMPEASQPGCRPGGNLLSAGSDHSLLPAGEIAEIAAAMSLEPPVAAAGQGYRGPRASSRRSTAGSPRGLPPPISKRQRRYWRSWRDNTGGTTSC